jgi:hypothetical protein
MRPLTVGVERHAVAVNSPQRSWARIDQEGSKGQSAVNEKIKVQLGDETDLYLSCCCSCLVMEGRALQVVQVASLKIRAGDSLT